MNVLCILISGLVIAALLYILHCQGLLVTKSIIAILFCLLPGKERERVSLDSCSGWVRYAKRFFASGPFIFELDFQRLKGHAAVSLLDAKKQELLRLDRTTSTGIITLNKQQRYYLYWSFQNASGNCELRWAQGK